MTTHRTRRFYSLRANGTIIQWPTFVFGLRHEDGTPVIFNVFYTIDEIAEDWVVVRELDTDDYYVFGNHPHAVGTLRDLLPDALDALPEFPEKRMARRILQRLLDRRGMVAVAALSRDEESRTIYVHFAEALGDGHAASLLAIVREYLPFRATVYWAGAPADRTLTVCPIRKD